MLVRRVKMSTAGEGIGKWRWWQFSKKNVLSKGSMVKMTFERRPRRTERERGMGKTELFVQCYWNCPLGTGWEPWARIYLAWVKLIRSSMGKWLVIRKFIFILRRGAMEISFCGLPLIYRVKQMCWHFLTKNKVFSQHLNQWLQGRVTSFSQI